MPQTAAAERSGHDPVLDDLIQVLTSKGVIRVTDLPAAAQAKLMDRSHAREALRGLSQLVEDDEAGLI